MSVLTFSVLVSLYRFCAAVGSEGPPPPLPGDFVYTSGILQPHFMQGRFKHIRNHFLNLIKLGFRIRYTTTIVPGGVKFAVKN